MPHAGFTRELMTHESKVMFVESSCVKSAGLPATAGWFRMTADHQYSVQCQGFVLSFLSPHSPIITVPTDSIPETLFHLFRPPHYQPAEELKLMALGLFSGLQALFWACLGQNSKSRVPPTPKTPKP